MKNIAARRLLCLLLLWAGLFRGNQAQADLIIGNIGVSNVTHVFRPFQGQDPNRIPFGESKDWLVDQSQTSGAGSVLPAFIADLDVERTFVLRIEAPAGKKFWIHPQPGRAVALEGLGNWQTTNGAEALPWLGGPCFVALENLVGTPPNLSGSVSLYPPGLEGLHLDFGASWISNELTFTALLVTGRVEHLNTQPGIRTFVPRSESRLFGYYAPNSTNDPGPALSLIPAEQWVDAFVPLQEAVDTDSSFNWSFLGNTYLPWRGRLAISHDGIDAAETGDVADNTAVTLQGKAVGPGTLNWWWKVSSETNHDYLKLFVDGVQQIRISGEVDWRSQSFRLTPGPHILKWTYSKDGSQARGLDKGWVDQVYFAPDTNCTFALSATDGTFSFAAATGTVTVATGPECPWPVVCTEKWIAVLSPVANRGSGMVTYALMRNPTLAPRTGYLNIAGHAFAITQAGGPTNLSPHGDLRQALDISVNVLIPSPTQWLIQPSITHASAEAAQFGPLLDNEITSMHAEIWGPGTLSFWWKVSSETNSDLFKFFGPEGEVRISGEVDWQFLTYEIGPGSNEVFWVYAKDENVSTGNDRGWLDQLHFAPETNCPVSLPVQNRRHGFGAESGSVEVRALTNCLWRAWTTAKWIHLPFNFSRVTDEVVNYTLSINETGQDRTGVIWIGNQACTIFQSNGVCTTAFFPTNAIYSWHRETSTVSVITFHACPLNFYSTNNWITILSNTPLNPGAQVAYAVADNYSLQPRRGALLINGKEPFEILQEGRNNGPLFENNILGTNVVTTIGHRFLLPGRPEAPIHNAPGVVIDYLLDQRQNNGGGSMLPDLFMIWDYDNQFTWKIAAPPGKRFVIRPPPGASALMESFLYWGSIRSGPGSPGSAMARFEGLEGTPPTVFGNATLTDTHGIFGLVTSSTLFTNSFSFTSLSLVGLVTPSYTGLGPLGFTPYPSCHLLFEYDTFLTHDPGRFVTLIPPDPALHLTIVDQNRTNGTILRLQGPRLQTNVVEVSSDLLNWTSIRTVVMPDIDCSVCPYIEVTDEGSINMVRRFYRAYQR